MQLFIKAAEVWQLDAASKNLRLSAGHYGGLEDFEAASKELTFGFGEGLPGETWSQACPQIWKDLTSDAFKRTLLADQAGIACGLSIPIFAGEVLLAVVVLFCGRGEEVTGAVEVWKNEPDSETELRLEAGYYGELERFEWISQRLTILRGRGLPGGAWATGRPLVIENLGESNTFLRARNAAEAGITTGLAVPFIDAERVRVVGFLSAKGTPIVKRFEIWLVDEKRLRLRIDAGHCESGTDLQALYSDVSYAKGQGTLGEIWLTGRPEIVKSDAGDEATLWVPQFVEGRLVAVVGLTF